MSEAKPTPPTQAMPPDVNDLGRSAFESLVETEWGGSQRQAAKALGVSSATLSDYVSGKKGAGGKLLWAVAAVSPETAMQMLGAAVGEERPGSRWAPSVVAELVARGFTRRIASWATLQALQLGTPETRKQLLTQAAVLAPAAEYLKKISKRRSKAVG